MKARSRPGERNSERIIASSTAATAGHGAACTASSSDRSRNQRCTSSSANTGTIAPSSATDDDALASLHEETDRVRDASVANVVDHVAFKDAVVAAVDDLAADVAGRSDAVTRHLEERRAVVEDELRAG